MRQFAFLFIIGFPIVAQATDDPTVVGIVDKVENEAKVVAASGPLFILRMSFAPGPMTVSGSRSR